MEIDWLTFIAQIVNFLILVALLKRFLYGPIVQAMEQREHKIAATLQDADAKMQMAQQEATQYQQLQRDWQLEQENLYAQAKREVETWKQTMLQTAREEVDRTRWQWQESLRQEQQAFLKHVRNSATHQVYAAIRRALADLANTALEQQMIAVFLEQLQTLPTDQQQALHAALTQNGTGAETAAAMLVQSAFPIPEASHQQLEQVIHDRITPNAHLHFEVAPDLINGIELKVNGYKLAWSLENYLTNLEARLTNAFEGEPADTR